MGDAKFVKVDRVAPSSGKKHENLTIKLQSAANVGIHQKSFQGSGAMAMVKCVDCGAEISDKAERCPGCGAPMAKEREVSFLWTLCFGCLYFFFKGWWKAGLVAMVLSGFTMGLAWFVLPFVAKKFVNALQK